MEDSILEEEVLMMTHLDLQKHFWSTPFMANRCWLNCFRSILLPASSVHLFFTITTGRYSSFSAFVAIFSIPSVARTVSFFRTCSEPSSPGVVASVSATPSETLTYALLFRCPVKSSPLTSAEFLFFWRAS